MFHSSASLYSMKNVLSDFFLEPVNNIKKFSIILIVAFIFIFFQTQFDTNDWDLNTKGFWSDILHTYDNQDFVYPPWGLILMLPYWLMRAEGARFFSVVIIGWLVVRQKWTLWIFFSIILSPYFLVTMERSNIDIFVFILPVLLWEKFTGTRWQKIAWGLALSILLLKPQGAVLLWLYLFWISRDRPKEWRVPMIIVALIVIPVSLIGSPPLISQWLDNISNPSTQNKVYWGVNNVSLTARFGFWYSVIILLLITLFLLAWMRHSKKVWTKNQTLAVLLSLSMFLSPYASQQSLSSVFAWIPSWGALLIQVVGLTAAIGTNRFYEIIPIWVLFFVTTSLLIFIPIKASLKD